MAALLCLAWLAAACTSQPPAAHPPASRSSPGSASASAPEAARSATGVELPRPADVCAAIRRSGLDVVATRPERGSISESPCKADIPSKGRRPRELPYTLRVRVESFRDAAQAELLYKTFKTADWQRGHSAFSGAAAQRAEVKGVGHARPGAQYDEGYYAFYPHHQVAGSKSSESVLTLRKGNLIASFDLLAGDLTGSTVASIQPVGADVGQKIFDTVADEVIALLRPAN